MFRSTSRLLDCRITFFTRKSCGLCDIAKAELEKVKLKSTYEYHEINVMDAGQNRWRDLYEFDTPVIHVDKVGLEETTASSAKLMHHPKEGEILQIMEQVEKS